jgi:hypothetical protein
MKSLFRWTIGDNSSKEGIECLSHSISLIKKKYGDSCDYFVCHSGNNVNNLNLKGVNFIDQRSFTNSISIKPFGTSWKLYPPRIRIDSHEIFLDNDLIVYGSLPIIDSFFKSDDVFFCTEGLKRRYGKYDSLIASHQKLNTGLFGLPPNFDFGQKIESKLSGNWEGHFDEQGLVASILLEYNVKVIPISDIYIACKDAAEHLSFGRAGIHFVGLNSGNSFYWNEYLAAKALI